MSTGSKQLRQFLAWAAPLLIGVVLLLLATLPFHSGPLAYVMPKVTLILVYYWTINFPDRVSELPIFLLGLIEDFWLAAPLGMHPLALLLVYALLMTQLNVFAGRPFALAWAGFAPIALAVAAIFWLMTCLAEAQLLGPLPFLIQALVTIAVYPLLGWLFGRIYRPRA